MLRRHIPALLLAAVFALLAGMSAAAPLEARIDKSDQEMTVYIEGRVAYRWPVSTARPGKETPNGTYAPQSMKRTHFSTLYNNAPMPYSIFFSGDYAIHGTTEIEKLGCPASAGCVRLHPDNARILFDLVRDYGFAQTRIVVQD